MTDTSGVNSTITSNIVSNTTGRITPAIVVSVLVAMTGWVYEYYVPHVSSLAALRSTLNMTASNIMMRDSYDGVHPAPPLRYVWDTTCPTNTPDNVARYVAPTSGGNSCWDASADPNIYDTREWGAINDSTALVCGTDNYGAIQSAVTALGSGARLYNDGWSCIKSTVVATLPGQKFACKGGGNGGGLHDAGSEFTAPSGFIWGGASGVTMFKYKSSTTQAANGWGMDCALNGLGVAAYGVNSFSSRGGIWDTYGAHFTGSIVRADIDTDITEAAGSSYNTYTIFVDQRSSGDGAAFQCFGTASWDCSQDQFPLVTGVWNGRVPAVDFDDSDTEQVHHVSLYDANAATGVCGIRFRAGATWVQTARNNFINYVGISSSGGTACPVEAEGTNAGGGRVVASNWNSVSAIDTATGGNNPPFVGTPGGALPGGATITASEMLWWGTNAAPAGLNYFTDYGPAFSQRTNAGVITNRGATTTITHGTYQDVTFSAVWSSTPALGAQLALPTACQSVSLAANFAIPMHYACTPGSSTILRIFNDSSTTDAAVVYEATGY